MGSRCFPMIMTRRLDIAKDARSGMSLKICRKRKKSDVYFISHKFINIVFF